MKLADQKTKQMMDKKAAAPQKFMASGSAASVPSSGRSELIKKFPVGANLVDYESTYSTFGWEDAKKELAYFAGGKLNAAYNAVDRHMHDGRRNKVALYCVDADNGLELFTFQDIYYV
jgi:hypothetical protein